MIRSATLFTGMIFFICAPLGAEDYALTFEKAVHNPVAFFGTAPAEAGEKGTGWIDGDEFLTKDAQSVIAYLGMGEGQNAALLLSVDTKADGADKPDTLYIDLNRNRTLDEAETFPLVLVDNKGAGPVMPFTLLCAEKVAYHDEYSAGGGPFHVNFYYPIIDDAPPGFGTAFGLSAWGCYSGRVTLDGVAYDVTLEDRTVNGSFCDFDSGSHFDCDSLEMRRADQEKALTGLTPPSPLRRKMLIGDRAFGVTVKENGRVLALESITVETGRVSTSSSDLAVNLSHPDWGSFPIEAGETKALPAGEWTIVDYSRVKKEPSSVCYYSAPTDKSVSLAGGESVCLDLATTLVAAVTATPRKGLVQLGLAMTTDGGATMRGFYSEKAKGRGIPFHITNAAGETLEKGTFEFG